MIAFTLITTAFTLITLTTRRNLTMSSIARSPYAGLAFWAVTPVAAWALIAWAVLGLGAVFLVSLAGVFALGALGGMATTALLLSGEDEGSDLFPTEDHEHERPTRSLVLLEGGRT